MPESRQFQNPSWWNGSHSSAWDRAKEALRRDWEQTKADLSDGGRDLNQDAGDTIQQAVGKQPLPPSNVPNATDDSWDDAEPAVRYGYGARQYYQKDEWNDELEEVLKKDWHAAGGEGTWERFKGAVRRGWEQAKYRAASTQVPLL